MELKYGLITAAGAGAGLAAWAIARNSRPLYNLRDKVVLITGGSRGLGLQMAREFGDNRAKLVLCARDAAELEEARKDLSSRGVETRTFVCDVSDRQQVQRMVDQAGPIDVLVNNAGIIRVGPLQEMTIADFETAMATIFWGTLNTTFAVLPQMRQRKQGRIVNITSIGGKISVPHLVPYSCAKFATVAFSEGLRAELDPAGIKVITIVPGLMRTGSHLEAEFKGQQKREYAWFSLGAATPVVSISAERAARSVVKSVRRGESEKILSLSADLLARFHGAFPELTGPLLSIVNKYVLPAPPERPPAAAAATDGESTQKGFEAAQEIGSKVLEFLTQMGRAAAQRMNEAQEKPA